MTARTENIQFEGSAGIIDCAFDWPDAEPVGWALVLHPHPLHGGTRNNKVVTTVSRACVDRGLLAIRPNFRGVGLSQGEFDKGRAETDDMYALVSQFAQRYPQLASRQWVAAGFSFGTAVAVRLYWKLLQEGRDVPETLMLVGTAAQRFAQSPADDQTLPSDSLLVHGEVDEVVALSEAMEFARGFELPMVVIPDASHFFHGKLLVLRSLIAQKLAAIPFV